MTDIRNYTDQYARQYAANGFETVLVEVRRRRVLKSILAQTHVTIVELGCGLEPLFEYVEAKRHIVVEPSPAFAAHAREAAAELPGARVIEAYAEDVVDEVRAARPDVIVVSSLLHEVPDPDRLVASAHAMCTPTTFVHFNVPNVRSFHRVLAYETGLIESVFEESETERRFERHTRYDENRLIETLTRGEFRIVESGSYFVKPFTHGQLDAIFAAGIVDPRVVAGLERMIIYMPGLGAEIYADATVA